jgi:deoxyribonuclease V
MIACVDVAYRGAAAFAAGVVFRDWHDALAVEEKVLPSMAVRPYEPGKFFLRELPCLLAVLRALPPVEAIVIDGYVWLDGAGTPGLGARLRCALDEKIAVIGVAKTRFRGAAWACEVLRGRSRVPLFVTAAGMLPQTAAEHIRSMHGSHRIPTLLQRVDQLCREAARRNAAAATKGRSLARTSSATAGGSELC